MKLTVTSPLAEQRDLVQYVNRSRPASFADSISQEDAWALVAYVRSLRQNDP